ncbi:MAG: hypothetical protein RIR26_2467, partial [Pseudomonadota bacterium]
GGILWMRSSSNKPTANFNDSRNGHSLSQQVEAQKAVSARNSLLIDVQSGKELVVCILARVPQSVSAQVSPSVARLRSSDVRPVVESLFQRWLSFLSLNRSWKKEEPKITFLLNESCSPASPPSLTIVADVGPLREAKSDDECLLRKAGALSGKFFADGDDRVCRAFYDTRTRTGLIAAGGAQGDRWAMARLIGGALGVGERATVRSNQDSKGEFSVLPVMAGGRKSFHFEDVVAINAVWADLLSPLPCVEFAGSGALSRQDQQGHVRCSNIEVARASLSEDGASVCPKGKKYWLSPLHLCVEAGGQSLPECPPDVPLFDPNSGVCCSAGQTFDPAHSGCRSIAAMKNDIEILLQGE